MVIAFSAYIWLIYGGGYEIYISPRSPPSYLHEELQSIEDNKTRTLCNLSPGRKCIETKWGFKTKRDGNNNFQRYKCRLVAKGYSQIAGIDFDKTFAPVVRIESVRSSLALAANKNFNIKHVDCKTAFLNDNSDL